jgi:hypothetical protein
MSRTQAIPTCALTSALRMRVPVRSVTSRPSPRSAPASGVRIDRSAGMMPTTNDDTPARTIA